MSDIVLRKYLVDNGVPEDFVEYFVLNASNPPIHKFLSDFRDAKDKQEILWRYVLALFHMNFVLLNHLQDVVAADKWLEEIARSEGLKK